MGRVGKARFSAKVLLSQNKHWVWGPFPRKGEFSDVSQALMGRPVYYRHQYDKPVGKITRTHVDENGDITIDAEIEASPKYEYAIRSIMSGETRAVSFAAKGVKTEETPFGARVVKEYEPFEVSIVDRGADKNAGIDRLELLGPDGDVLASEEFARTEQYQPPTSVSRTVPRAVPDSRVPLGIVQASADAWTMQTPVPPPPPPPAVDAWGMPMMPNPWAMPPMAPMPNPWAVPPMPNPWAVAPMPTPWAPAPAAPAAAAPASNEPKRARHTVETSMTAKDLKERLEYAVYKGNPKARNIITRDTSKINDAYLLHTNPEVFRDQPDREREAASTLQSMILVAHDEDYAPVPPTARGTGILRVERSMEDAMQRAMGGAPTIIGNQNSMSGSSSSSAADTFSGDYPGFIVCAQELDLPGCGEKTGHTAEYSRPRATLSPLFPMDDRDLKWERETLSRKAPELLMPDDFTFGWPGWYRPTISDLDSRKLKYSEYEILTAAANDPDERPVIGPEATARILELKPKITASPDMSTREHIAFQATALGLLGRNFGAAGAVLANALRTKGAVDANSDAFSCISKGLRSETFKQLPPAPQEPIVARRDTSVSAW